MDLGLPVMDGWEATRAVESATTSTQHIPIIVLSAHAMTGDRDLALAAGGDDFDYQADPLRAAARQDRGPARRKAPSHVKRHGSLLVVDDNEANRDALSRRLRQRGYAVSMAGERRAKRSR